MPKRKLSESSDALQAPLCNGRLALDVEAPGNLSPCLAPRPRHSRVSKRGCEIGNGAEQGAHEDMGAMGAMGAKDCTPFVSSVPFDTDKLTLNDAVVLAVGACCFTISEIQVRLFELQPQLGCTTAATLICHLPSMILTTGPFAYAGICVCFETCSKRL